jgi:hypothetical protein
MEKIMNQYLIKSYSLIESENDYMIVVKENDLIECNDTENVEIEKSFKTSKSRFHFCKSKEMEFPESIMPTIPLIVVQESGKNKVIELQDI